MNIPIEKSQINDYLKMYDESQQKQVIKVAETAYDILNRTFPTDFTEQYDLTNQLIQDFTDSQSEFGESDEHGRITVKRINIYSDLQGTNLITIDIHDGTTPLTLKHPSNKKLMKSLGYLCPKDAIPEAEWYRPTAESIATMPKKLQDYCFDGGLILRKLNAKEDDLSVKQKIKMISNLRLKANVLKAKIKIFLKKETLYFDEADTDVMYQDFENNLFFVWSFDLSKNHNLRFSLEFCDPAKEENCKLFTYKQLNTFEEFVNLFEQVKSQVNEKTIKTLYLEIDEKNGENI